MAVALAGPASNLLLSMGAVFGATELGWWTGSAVQNFVRCNMTLMIMNMIPALPLDGGRIVRAALTRRMTHSRATRTLSAAGIALGAGLLALGAYLLTKRQLNITLLMSGPYLIYSAMGERDEGVARVVSALSRRAEEVRGAGVLPTRWLTVSSDLPIASLPQRFHPQNYHMITIVDPAGLRTLGTISESELLDALVRDQSMRAGGLV